VTDFDLWDRNNLVQLAKDSLELIKQQRDRIEQLEEDLKAAIEAYRQLNRER
jgi:hypothetical protein